MKKQSSIEWLEEKLKPYIMLEKSKANEIIKQAKEMHKVENIEAVTFGQNNHTVMISPDLEKAEEYYTETFTN
jgi:hypothetical protein